MTAHCPVGVQPAVIPCLCFMSEDMAKAVADVNKLDEN